MGVGLRLADFVVSYSLQINNRCLRYLAECDVQRPHVEAVTSPSRAEPLQAEMHTVYAESLLARDSRRLASMWALTGLAGKASGSSLAAHIEELQKQSANLADVASARRLALRLASLAQDDEDAQAMLQTARQLPADSAPTWDRLNELFAADSGYWRQPRHFEELDDELLIGRIARSYRKGYRLARELQAIKNNPDRFAWLTEKHVKLCGWVQACAHQMELLRSGLSDTSKAQLWYMDKLADTLRMRAGLVELAQRERDAAAEQVQSEQAQSEQAQVEKMRAEQLQAKSARQRSGRYISDQIAKMDKRTLRLLANCFPCKPKKFSAMMHQSIEGLALHNIRLMVPGGGRDEAQPAGAAGA